MEDELNGAEQAASTEANAASAVMLTSNRLSIKEQKAKKPQSQNEKKKNKNKKEQMKNKMEY